MKISSSTSYPYPIWGWRDDYSSSITDNDYEIREIDDKDNFIYELELFVHNEDLEKLIAAGKAIYACTAICTSTFKMYCFKSDKPVLQIKIPRQEVNQKVELMWMILSTKAVPDFESQMLNPDYQGKASFPLGAILAYITSFEINPTICDEMRSLDEIFVVVKNTETNEIKYSFDDRKIKIKLPNEQLEVFNNHGGKYSAVMHSTIVMQALMLAISKIQEADENLDWVYILKQYIDTINSDEIPSTDEGEAYTTEQCLDIANYILQSPNIRMFDEIKTVEELAEQVGSNFN